MAWRGLLLVGMLLTTDAWASDEVEDLRPDPPDVWHRIGHDEATTDSRCIGNPVTPRCAIETYEACWLRHELPLCDTIRLPGFPASGFRGPPLHRENSDLYRVVRAYFVKRDILKAEGKELWNVYKGDLAVEVLDRNCSGGKCYPLIKGKPPTTYFLRKVDGRWLVIAIDTPRY